MLKAIVIGNLTRDPELRSTQSGIPVCSFTLAVNRRNQSAEAGKQEADFVRVTAWHGLGENCSRYLAKGKKAAVTGTLTLGSYTGNDGIQRYQLEVQADEVEFLTPREASGTPAGFVRVEEDDLPF